MLSKTTHAPKIVSARLLPSEPWPPEILGLPIKGRRLCCCGFSLRFLEALHFLIRTTLLVPQCFTILHFDDSIPWEAWVRSRKWVSEQYIGSGFDIWPSRKARWFEMLVLKTHLYLTSSLYYSLISGNALSLRYEVVSCTKNRNAINQRASVYFIHLSTYGACTLECIYSLWNPFFLLQIPPLKYTVLKLKT